MNNFAIEKKLISQLIHIKKEKKPSEDVLKSLYAQAIIEHSIYQYKKDSILNEIDMTLEHNDKEKFISLSEKYNQLLDEYKQGKILYEKGLEVNFKFE